MSHDEREKLFDALEALKEGLELADHILSDGAGSPEGERDAVGHYLDACVAFISATFPENRFVTPIFMLTALNDIESGSGAATFLVATQRPGGAPPSSIRQRLIRDAAAEALEGFVLAKAKKSVGAGIVARDFNAAGLARELPQQAKYGITPAAIIRWHRKVFPKPNGASSYLLYLHEGRLAEFDYSKARIYSQLMARHIAAATLFPKKNESSI